MRSHLAVCLLLAAALSGSPRASAYPKHEFIFGSESLLGLAGQSTGGEAFFNSGTVLAATLSYNYTLLPMLQFGVNTAILHITSGTSSSTGFQILGGPTINFATGSEAIFNSVFITVMGGLVDGTTTQGALSAELGYRFRVLPNFSIRPSGGIYKILNGSSMLIVLRPFSFSVVF